MSMQFVKIFGERNTGTNVLSMYIKRNTSSKLCGGTFAELSETSLDKFKYTSRLERERLIDNFFLGLPPSNQWKHAATNFEDRELSDFANKCVIITLRNPISWVLGLYKNPYNALTDTSGLTPEQFICTKWTTLKRDRLNLNLVTPPELISLKMQSYCNFSDRLEKLGQEIKFVNFESFVLDPQITWSRISSTFVNAKTTVDVIKQSLKDKSKDVEYYKDYYGNERWRDEVSNSAIAEISENIDWNSYNRLKKMCDIN